MSERRLCSESADRAEQRMRLRIFHAAKTIRYRILFFLFFCLTSRTFLTLMTDYSSMDAICRMRAMRATWSQVPRVERARARVFKSIFAATVCLLCGCGDFCLSFFFFPSLIGNRRNLCAHYTSGPARRVRYQSIKLYST